MVISMNLTILIAAVFAAMTTACAADALDDNDAICVAHKHANDAADFGTPRSPKTPPEYAAGWEHCARIAAAKKARDDAAAAADEATTPDLKATRDFAKTLGN